MKQYVRIIAMIMVAVSILCVLSGCKNKKNQEPTTEATSPVEDTTPTDVIETEPVETEPPAPTEPEYFTNDSGTYRKVNEQVHTEGKVYLRMYPNGKKVCDVDSGIVLTRVGIGDENGWSIVIHNDSEVYVPTYYLTPLNPPTYVEVNEVVVATEEANLRSSPSINSEARGKIALGGELVRIGIGTNGWSKALYKGGEAYIFSLYVKPKAEPVQDPTEEATEPVDEEAPSETEEGTTESTEPTEETEATEAPTEPPTSYEYDGVVYEIVDETVEAAITVNVRKEPSTDSELVGKLAGGKRVQRIAIGENGWSKIIYMGEEAYIFSDYLIKR